MGVICGPVQATSRSLIVTVRLLGKLRGKPTHPTGKERVGARNRSQRAKCDFFFPGSFSSPLPTGDPHGGAVQGPLYICFGVSGGLKHL